MQKSARFSFCCNAAVAYLLEFIIIFPVQFIFKYSQITSRYPGTDVLCLKNCSAKKKKMYVKMSCWGECNKHSSMYKATVPKSSDVADPDPKELDENTGKGASQKLKMFFLKFRQLQYSIL